MAGPMTPKILARKKFWEATANTFMPGRVTNRATPAPAPAQTPAQRVQSKLAPVANALSPVVQEPSVEEAAAARARALQPTPQQRTVAGVKALTHALNPLPGGAAFPGTPGPVPPTTTYEQAEASGQIPPWGWTKRQNLWSWLGKGLVDKQGRGFTDRLLGRRPGQVAKPAVPPPAPQQIRPSTQPPLNIPGIASGQSQDQRAMPVSFPVDPNSTAAMPPSRGGPPLPTSPVGPAPGAALAMTDRLIGNYRKFVNRQPGVNLTEQNMGPVAPGGYAPGRVKIGGGLRLRGPAALDALNAPAVAAAPQAAPQYFNPKSPVYTPEQQAAASIAGDNAAKSVEARSRFGTTAIPLAEQKTDINGNLIPGLRGGLQDMRDRTLVGGAKVLDPDKREAYLMQQAGIAGDRYTKVRQSAMADRVARRDRMAGPSALDMLAQRNPQTALALAALQQQGRIAAGEQALRRDNAKLQYGERPGARYQADTAADVAILDSEFASQRDKQAAAARISQRSGGGGVSRSGGGPVATTPITAIPQGDIEAIEKLPVQQGAAKLREWGVPGSQIAAYEKRKSIERNPKRQNVLEAPGVALLEGLGGPSGGMLGGAGVFGGSLFPNTGIVGRTGEQWLESLARLFGSTGTKKPLQRVLTPAERRLRQQGLLK